MSELKWFGGESVEYRTPGLAPRLAQVGTVIHVYLNADGTGEISSFILKTGATVSVLGADSQSKIPLFRLADQSVTKVYYQINGGSITESGPTDESILAILQEEIDLGGGGTSTPTPDATSTVKGKIQLAGDLAGTAAAPTVPGLASKADSSVVFTKTQSDARYPRSVNNVTPDGNGNITISTGSTPTDATTGAKGIIRLAGDLGGTADAPTVPGMPKTKSDLGLGNVDNTADTAKPVSTAQQTALNTKGNKSETVGYRKRTDANEAAPTATNWPPRPTGYLFVISVGADPSPNDQVAGDQRSIPVN